MHTREIEYDKENGCFICTSHIPNKIGYPKLMSGGKIWLVKDYIYNGVDPIGEDYEIILTCGERLCINIEHMVKVPKDREIVNKNNRAILTKEKVVEIKKLLRKGKRKAEIADMFGVSPSCIYNIHDGRTWKYVK